MSSKIDKIFEYDEAYIDLLRAEKPWEKDRKHFSKVKISALAAMKMLQHSLAGVDKGRKLNGTPIEIMGLCIGKPEGDSVVVFDTVPLPVEGTETQVVADQATTYMAQISDSLEHSRKDRFIGWYHSHPFDVTTYSHCHLSSTDVQSQNMWQFQMPFWLAIVVDPLRSIAKQEPIFGCFRSYPPQYNPPNNQAPDGRVINDKTAMVTRWGHSYHRYYSLEISYFMSAAGQRVLEIMARDNLWIRVLASSAVMEPENRARFAERVKQSTQQVKAAKVASRGMGREMKEEETDELSQATQATQELALEQVVGHVSQVTKDALFNVSHVDLGKKK